MRKIRKKSKIKVSDIALFIVLILAIVFTSVIIWLFIKYQSIPDTLVTCVFAALFGELGCLTYIKKLKENRSCEVSVEEEEG